MGLGEAIQRLTAPPHACCMDLNTRRGCMQIPFLNVLFSPRLLLNLYLGFQGRGRGGDGGICRWEAYARDNMETVMCIYAAHTHEKWCL